ncbi:MAG TPA: AIR synthase-related protein, partial [Terriglobales bacterium]|nr:AIR synthase-related protein [Terriglobales bacterium]
ESAHDCSEGGLAVALAECSFANAIGMNVKLASSALPAEFVLFGEDASRVVISCDTGNLLRIQEAALEYGVSVDIIGETAPAQMEIVLDGRVAVSAPINELRDAYEGALEKALQMEPQLVAAG